MNFLLVKILDIHFLFHFRSVYSWTLMTFSYIWQFQILHNREQLLDLGLWSWYGYSRLFLVHQFISGLLPRPNLRFVKFTSTFVTDLLCLLIFSPPKKIRIVRLRPETDRRGCLWPHMIPILALKSIWTDFFKIYSKFWSGLTLRQAWAKNSSFSVNFGNIGATVATVFLTLKMEEKSWKKNVEKLSLTKDYHSNSKN